MKLFQYVGFSHSNLSKLIDGISVWTVTLFREYHVDAAFVGLNSVHDSPHQLQIFSISSSSFLAASNSFPGGIYYLAEHHLHMQSPTIGRDLFTRNTYRTEMQGLSLIVQNPRRHTCMQLFFEKMADKN